MSTQDEFIKNWKNGFGMFLSGLDFKWTTDWQNVFNAEYALKDAQELASMSVIEENKVSLKDAELSFMRMKELTVVYELTSVEFLFERGRTLYGKEPDHYTNPKNGNWGIGVGATIALFLEDPSPKTWTEINDIIDRAKGHRYTAPALKALTETEFLQ